MATPEHDAGHDEALAGGATPVASGPPSESGGRRGTRRAARRRLLIWSISVGAALAVVTTAVAKVVNPDLAVLPPVIRDQVGLPVAPGSAAPSLPSASATPSITASPSSPPPGTTAGMALLSYEAESAAHEGGRVRRLPSASGGRIVGGLDRSDDHVTFTVTVSAAGPYTVTFYYISGGTESRVAVITVNSGTPTSHSFPSTGWETVESRALSIDLAAGTNKIRFASNGTSAPDLDRITVTR